jgi:hypothetical protein
MPRRKNKTMKGGFWDTVTDMFKKKPATPVTTTTPSSSTPITTSTTPSTTPSTIPSSTTTPITTTTGGKGRRAIKGGYAPNHSLTNLASKAAPFSGSETAQPQVWLGGPHMKGGKSRKLRKSRKSRKSRRNRRH